MSHFVTRHKKAAAWRKCWSTLASRHAPANDACERRERDRSDRAAATRARRAVQERIVGAFRKYVHGTGNGPADEDLIAFARVAIAEQRLGRRLELGLGRSMGKENRRGL
jgi:hypothetical protein